MMTIIFATLTLALLAGRFGPRWFAVTTILVCLVLSAGLFLYEIYNPDYGFRMPWLRVDNRPHPHWPGVAA